MPITATTKMRRLQARWFTGTVRIWTETPGTDVNPATGVAAVVESDVWTGASLVRSDSVTRLPGEGRVFGKRILDFKVAAEAPEPLANMRVRITATDDPTLVGAEGTIVDVTRDPIQAARRFTAEMDNSR